MVRIFFLVAGLSCLGACSWSGQGLGGSSWQPAGPSAQGFRFDWQLSGDPAVAPLQVFDDGRETWLQFQPGQPLPAIFGVGSDGEQALPYVRRDPYVVVVGAWKGLSFRGGRLTARAQRAQSAEAASSLSTASARSGAVESRPPEAAASGPDLAHGMPSVSTPAVSLAPSAPSAAAAPTPLTRKLPDDVSPLNTPAAAQASLYRAAPPDATLRAVLARWAIAAGWTFQPQHWAVDVDIPLSASAEFSGDFKSAVRELLGSTELADRPLQPCFYGNRVLRVVPLAQSCSRAAAQGAAA
ncbi:TcpQ domain-containing protein [Achromobacter arsenitoxydans]|uniref:Type IV pilus assembly protein n=1 Tax=Achromobacter arsenitoxydans SY8 TaxID=477184 RepID=H0FA50_9BURK|nr:TcpQ domain-containing protein [Achromobacter arsenitoxydans]EHK64857.1 type IV pilus assembly protein [Achromobacter arsenitoxydans SY8]